MIWGNLPSSYFNQLFNDAGFLQDKTISVRYEEKKGDLNKQFTEALAQGDGPDLILITQDDLWNLKNKLTLIPYGSVSQSTFKSTFVEGSEVYLSADGIYALPLLVDPIILYYNRDLLSAAALAKPLAFWDELYSSTNLLTKKDAVGNLTQSAIALGETKNIANFKDIFAMLMLQAGTPITSNTTSGLQAVMSNSFNLPVSPGESAIDFYTQFANPSKTFYSWNRSLPEAQTSFTAGDVAYYLGFASEYKLIKSKSPTLNFSIATAPQSRVSGKVTTFGNFYALALSRGSKNPSAALGAILKLISADNISIFSHLVSLPPARRDLLADKQSDDVNPTLYVAALQAKAWIDPSPADTETIFKNAIDAVVSGRSRASEAVSNANSLLDKLIKN